MLGRDEEGHRWWLGLPWSLPFDAIWLAATLAAIGVAIALRVSDLSKAVADYFVGGAVGVFGAGVSGVADRKAHITRTRRLAISLEPPRMSLFDSAANLGALLYDLQLNRQPTQTAQVRRKMADRAMCIGGMVPAALRRELGALKPQPPMALADPDVMIELGIAIEHSADYFVRLAFSAGWRVTLLIDEIIKGHSSKLKQSSHLGDLIRELKYLDRVTGPLGDRVEFILNDWRRGNIITDDDAIAFIVCLLCYLRGLSRVGIADTQAARRRELLCQLVKYEVPVIRRKSPYPGNRRHPILAKDFAQVLTEVAKEFDVSNVIRIYQDARAQFPQPA